MQPLFPYANSIAAMMIFIVGFCFHWLGQLISLLNWDLATRLGLQESALLPEYRVYERAIATADVALGWIYGLAALGLWFDFEWGYRLAWIPGSILLYHAISAWFWEKHRRAAGHRLWSEPLRIGWCAINAATAVLALLLAWTGPPG